MTRSIVMIGRIVGVLAIVAVSWWLIESSNEQQDSLQDAGLLESGVALFHEKKYQESFELLKGITMGSPQEWRAKYYQGSALLKLKDYDSAVEFLEQALALNNRNTQIMHALGVAYFKLGNLKLSKAYYAAILEIDPTDTEAKGLMDIMANLEREQPSANQEETANDNEKEVEDH